MLAAGGASANSYQIQQVLQQKLCGELGSLGLGEPVDRSAAMHSARCLYGGLLGCVQLRPMAKLAAK
jgi:hypothetical protein